MDNQQKVFGYIDSHRREIVDFLKQMVSFPTIPIGKFSLNICVPLTLLIGVLVYIIRAFGGYPDGVAFSVLLMNIAAPTIDLYTQPQVFGARRG